MVTGGPDRLVAHGPALGALELASVARGIVSVDQMVKRAEASVVAARTFSPGRYLILISGPEAEVEEAMAAGAAAADEDQVDTVILHDPARELLAALAGALEPPASRLESLAIVETTTISSALLALDRALKDTDVRLLELRLGAGLSGKGVFTLTGPLHMIDAARDVVKDAIPEPRILRIETIAQPHPDVPELLLGAEGAWVRGRQKQT